MSEQVLGYACINMGFSERPKKQRITTNRSMIKRTFQESGLPSASELALANCRDLLTVLKWNEQHDIRFFRLSSDLFPWSSEYQLSDLPDYDAICDALMDAGVIHRLESKNAFFACRRPEHGFEKGKRPLVLACESCGAVAEVDSGRIFETISEMAEAAKFVPRVKFVEVSGLCPRCAGSKSKQKS